MASVVEDVELTNIAGHTYRQRIHPITGSRNRGQHAGAAQQQDWQAEDFEELEILTMEDEQIDESLINQEGDSYVTQLSVDPQVGLSQVPEHTWLLLTPVNRTNTTQKGT
jgi:hypothetical protein